MDRTSVNACKYIRPATNSACIQAAGGPSDRELSQTHRPPEASFPARGSARNWDRNPGDGEIHGSSQMRGWTPPEGARRVRASVEAASGLQQTAGRATKFPV